MSSVKAGFLSSFRRTDSPRRETLRRELARERARDGGAPGTPELFDLLKDPSEHRAGRASPRQH